MMRNDAGRGNDEMECFVMRERYAGVLVSGGNKIRKASTGTYDRVLVLRRERDKKEEKEEKESG